ncbi:MAG: response regulator [Kofleriaceae bacterium]
MSEPVILLVDDNANDVELTLRALQRNHIAARVIVAADGAEALDCLFARGLHADRTKADTPRLILLDWNLPRISGHEVVRAIRDDERTGILPVVVLTTADDDAVRRAAYGAGANSYVRKPVEFEAFAAAINQICMYWLVLNDRP